MSTHAFPKRCSSQIQFQQGSGKVPVSPSSSRVPARLQGGSSEVPTRFQQCSGFAVHAFCWHHSPPEIETQQNGCWELRDTAYAHTALVKATATAFHTFRILPQHTPAFKIFQGLTRSLARRRRPNLTSLNGGVRLQTCFCLLCSADSCPPNECGEHW